MVGERFSKDNSLLYNILHVIVQMGARGRGGGSLVESPELT